MKIDHTSRKQIGQVYIGAVNWTLMALTIILVIVFQRSTELAAAYGMAVSTTMVITTVMAYVVAREVWQWGWIPTVIVTIFFLIPDISFFSANLTKFYQGGWFPLLVAAVIYTLMSTWRTGRKLLWRHLKESRMPIEKYLDELQTDPPQRVSGTAVFLTGSTYGVPPALMYQIEHNKVLHEQVILLTVITRNVPYLVGQQRIETEKLDQNFYRVTARHGFMENPDIQKILRWCQSANIEIELSETSFFLGRETIIPSKKLGMSFWRAAIFAFMSRNALQATAFFRIPHERVIELGVQVEV
jgi:KUP system potassium uptake protein